MARSILAILCTVASVLSPVRTALNQESPTPRRLPSKQEFRQFFEAALDSVEPGAIEAAVSSAPLMVLGLFRQYLEEWSENDSPDVANKDIDPRIHSLAKAVFSLYDSPVLTDSANQLENLAASEREAVQQAVFHHQEAEQLKASDRQAAVESYRAAQAIYSATRLSAMEGIVLIELGDYLRNQREYEDAASYLRQARELYEEPSPLHEAMALGELAKSLRELGNEEEAIVHFKELWHTGMRIDSHSSVRTAALGLGRCYRDMGRFQDATRWLKKGIELARKSGSTSSLTASLTALGNSYRQQGRYQDAIVCHEQSLQEKRRAGDKAGQANALSNLGVCYSALRQIEDAASAHSQALELRREYGSPRGVALSLSNLGHCYARNGDLRSALSYHSEALELRKKEGTPRDIAKSFHHLGECQGQLQHYEQAIDWFERALEIERAVGKSYNLARVLNSLGYHHLLQGNLDPVFEYLQESLQLRSRTGNRQRMATTLGNLGRYYHALGQHKTAMEYWRRTIGAVAEVPRRTLTEPGRVAFADAWRELPWLISHSAFSLAELEGVAAAFHGVETMLGRVLLEGMQEKWEGVTNTDPELGRLRTQLLKTFETTRLAQEKAANDNASAEESRQLLDRLAATDKDLLRVEKQLRRKSPRLMELLAPEVTSTEELSNQLLRPGQALLRFVLGETCSYLYVITPEGLELIQLAAEQVLRKVFDQLMESLQDPARQDLTFVKPSRELYRLLLGPAASVLEPMKHLIIVPDGFLGALPFDALLYQDAVHDSSDRGTNYPYVVRKWSVQYAPSASFLTYLSQHKSDRTVWSKDFLILGDAVYEDESFASRERALSSLDPRKFERLKKTREEALALSRHLVQESEAEVFLSLRDLGRSGRIEAKRFDLFLGADASEDRLRGDLSRYRVLHLATHGYFDTEYPWFSGLVLSIGSAEEKHSGYLSLPEIASLHLDAELVFLSACETAKGKVLRSEGIQNTARSFLLAGARTVVATQWVIVDRVAPLIASVFYEQFLAGMPAVEALRKAKLALIKDHAGVRGAKALGTSDKGQLGWAHPSIWAPFILYGGVR
jgi:CHAT domain-containing protein/Tfp pilus assembly protein PilF